MDKDIIEINGKKYKAVDPNEGEEGAEGGEQKPDEGSENEVKAAAKAIREELGIDKLLDQVKSTADRVEASMNDPVNARLKELLHGKDFMNDKDQLTKEEKIVGFFHALVTKNERAIKALAEGTGSGADGGNLFPTEFANEIVKQLAEPLHMRAQVTVKTMRRNTLTVPARGTLAKVYWTAENAAKTTTTATWSQVTLTARKAAAIIYASDELIEDSTEFSVVAEIIDQFAMAIAAQEDFAILRGNGTTQPTGIETARSASTIPSFAANNNTLDLDAILKLIYAVKAKYRPGSIFLIHPNCALRLRQVKDSQNRYIWQEPTNGLYATLYGYPVLEFYDLPSSVTYFGNFKLGYWLGDRKSMTVKISNDTQTAFTQDETAIRVVFRLGGNVVLPEAINAVTHTAQ